MEKKAISYSLSVTFIKEKKAIVAYSPALDLSTVGKTLKQAMSRFEEAAKLFFEELEEMGTTNQVLQELGWEKVNKTWQPPVIISTNTEKLKIYA